MGRSTWLKLTSGVTCAVLLGGCLIFRAEIENRWNGYKLHEKAISLMSGDQWSGALDAAYAACKLRPSSTAYRQTYTEARRGLLESLKSKLAGKPPFDCLLEIDALAKEKGSIMGDEGLNQLRALKVEHEPGAVEQLKQAFSLDWETLSHLFKGHENQFSELFSPGTQEQAKVLLAGWQALQASELAWAAKDPDQTAEALEKTPLVLRKAVYDGIEKRLEDVRKDILQKLEAANSLVIQNDFLGAKAAFTALQSHESWVNALRPARLGSMLAGESYYTKKMVEANLAKDYKTAGDWLQKLLTLQGQKTENINFEEIFGRSTTTAFLNTLATVGLHPASPNTRTNFSDALLVAANIDNFSDPEEAHKFLSDAYLDWASKQLENGKPESAAYLALLAQKHGNTAAGEVFEKARTKLADRYLIVASTTPPKMSPKNASKQFADSLYYESAQMLRKSLPATIKYEDSDNPIEATNVLFRLKFTPTLLEIASDYQRNFRPESKQYFVSVLKENPDYESAVEEVQRAQDSLEQQQNSFAQLQSQASANEANLASQANPFAGFASALDKTANTVILNSAKDDVDSARSNLRNAQRKLGATPRQVQEKEERTATWNETDHVTAFRATFPVTINAQDQLLWTHTFESTAKHKSIERRGDTKLGLSAMEREKPDMDRIEEVLLKDLKQKIQLFGGQSMVQQLKSSISKYINSSGSTSPEALQDTIIGCELIWWDTPLRDYKALADSMFLGRFGDVVPVP